MLPLIASVLVNFCYKIDSVYFVVFLFFLPDKSLDSKAEKTQHVALWELFNPFKKQKVWEDEDSLPENIRRNVDRKISQFTTYDATVAACLQDFDVIKQNTECVFAKKAKLWGSSPWLQESSIGQ